MNQDDYEVIEVPVQKVQVSISFDAVLSTMAAHARTLATQAQETQPEVSRQLQQLSQISAQLRGRVP
jgi:hypothetical protein